MNVRLPETRVGLVKRLIVDAINAGHITMVDFADRVQVLYFDRTPEAYQDTFLRVPHPTDGESHQAARKLNTQNIRRMLGGENPIPYRPDMEEALILALPEVQREEALHELSARYGLLAVKPRDPTDAMGCMSGVLREFSHVVEAYGPIASDGRIDALDAPHIPDVLAEIGHAEAQLASLRVMLLNALNASNVTPITAAKAKA